ncbi:MAG TPA: alkene reductase [Chryseolinea sp.]
MSSKTTLSPYKLGNLPLKNRIVMAPMTRSRAIGNIPNKLMAEYYQQRASAGLIITEGISPSPNGLGYARIPGLFSDQQVEGWREVTDAVHGRGGKIFAQIMHTGRIAHSNNLPAGAKVLAPSSVHASGLMWTDQDGMLEHSTPAEMDLEEIESTKAEYVRAARNAVVAGFDGIELHGANGYLLEQFLSPHSNQRADQYGGSLENRARFVLEVAREISEAIGSDKTAIRLSPYGVFNEMPHYDEIDATYAHLARELDKIGIAYIHLVDHSSGGAPEVPLSIKKTIRDAFKNTLIHTGGYTIGDAERDVNSGLADLVGFGKPFISNPDLVDRFKKNFPLNIKMDASTFYTPGSKGYTDYPVFEEETVSA